jgi:hypothetical protein
MKTNNNRARALLSLKALFQADDNWNFYQKNRDRLRPAIVENVLKILNCRHRFAALMSIDAVILNVAMPKSYPIPITYAFAQPAAIKKRCNV